MQRQPTVLIEQHFRTLKDPRIERSKRHKLLDIIDPVILACHRTDLRKLRCLHAGQQVSGRGCLYLKGSHQHIQCKVPAVLVAAVEKALSLGQVVSVSRWGHTGRQNGVTAP